MFWAWGVEVWGLGFGTSLGFSFQFSVISLQGVVCSGLGPMIQWTVAWAYADSTWLSAEELGCGGFGAQGLELRFQCSEISVWGAVSSGLGPMIQWTVAWAYADST